MKNLTTNIAEGLVLIAGLAGIFAFFTILGEYWG